jgi:hypothetical protein|nr:MAG TPA: hypothetical protein [Caudoviricetes sp.]
MKNREKYAEQIIDMALNDIEIAVDKEGRLCDCNEIDCNDCMFCIPGCRERLKEWSEQEYVKPTVDWSKVPVDTKILVRDSEDGRWEKRHFARYKNNIVFAWCNGHTSYSDSGYDVVQDWKYAKLAEEDV